MAPEHVGGTQHVIAICPPDQDLSKVAENSRCTLLRLSSKDEVSSSPPEPCSYHVVRLQ